MGQCATIYRIDKNEIPKFSNSLEDLNILELAKSYEIFSKSFDGLIFVLSKNLDQANKELIEQIFYPKKYFGDLPDYSKIDFENLSDNLPEELLREPNIILYNAPAVVSEIYELLDGISIENFIANFDHNELNRHDIYPSGIWNNKTEENTAFNIQHMAIEFEKLKSFYKQASESYDYVLSYVG